MNMEDIKEHLFDCYSIDLCYPKVKSQWNVNNKCFGMCAITALIINDYLGGAICKIHVNGISHYYNLINDEIIDLTCEQFNCDIDYNNYEIVERKTILTSDTKHRYNILKERLINKINKT